MAKQKEEELAELLWTAAVERKLRPRGPGEPWVYGWCSPAHRHSPAAVIPFDKTRVVRFSKRGVKAIESAVERLLKQASFQKLWHEEEIWGVVASMIATLPIGEDEQRVRDALANRLERLTSPGPTVVVFPVAHVAWKGPPCVIGPAVLGRLGDAWMAALRDLYGSPLEINSSAPSWWEEAAGLKDAPSHDRPVIIGVVVRSAGKRAHEDAEAVFNGLIELSLLLAPDLKSRGLLGLRGDVFRPGIRGLRVDRHALERIGQTCKPVLSELAAAVYVQSRATMGTSHHWYGEAPWPLEDLLQSEERRAAIVELLAAQGPIGRRFRIAARWYARAHWSSNEQEAILALGIALEALLAESGGGPGAILGERYALLHSGAKARKQAYDYFMKKIYEARSAVAHGRVSDLLEDFHFIRDVAERTAWVANTLNGWVKKLDLKSDEDHRKLFSDLKWGVKPSGSSSRLDVRTGK